jgi:hypothetical protein
MLKEPNGNPQDRFGSALALSGDTLIVAAPREDSSAVGIDGDATDNGASDAGAVYVFARGAGGQWNLEAYLKASNTDAGDRFGQPGLALEGDVLVVGAEYEDSAALGVNGDQSSDSAENAGAVYVFTRNAERRWTQVAYLKASNTDAWDQFGAVSLAGDVIVVGAPGEQSMASGLNADQSNGPALASDVGAVYAFR